MDNMRIYNAARACPDNAKRSIQAGKLKGKTDINPMWRIRQLTEMFGPAGEGWRTGNLNFWTTPGANGEQIAWCSLDLFYKQNGEWSDPVFGIGGSMMVDTQRGQLASNDEAYKMAYTDAISVATKALGFAADVYWDKDSTKYSRSEEAAAPKTKAVCEHCGKLIQSVTDETGKTWSMDWIIQYGRRNFEQLLCYDCCAEATRRKKAAAIEAKKMEAAKQVMAHEDGTL